MALAFIPYLLELDVHSHTVKTGGSEAGTGQARRISDSAERLTHAVSRSQTSAEQMEKVLASAEETNDRLAELVENLAASTSGDPSPEFTRIKEMLAAIESTLAGLADSVRQLADRDPVTPAGLEALSRQLSDQIKALNQPAIAPPVPEAGESPVSIAHEPPTRKETPAALPAESSSPETRPDEPPPTSADLEDDAAWDRDLGLDELEQETKRFTFNDESTSLIATAYIGIGNKLYLRGDGPGLRPDKGVPMQFLSIGKWGWSTLEATDAITCRIYKNDDEPAIDGDITLQPKELKEISPRF
jgi:chemotaxis protein histidine kinase CheA